MQKKPVIVKVVKAELEEKTPPQADEYEFVEHWPKEHAALRPPGKNAEPKE